MKTLAFIAAAVLACAIVPLQAFSDDNYQWGDSGNQTGSSSEHSNDNGPNDDSNETISFGDSNGTVSFGFSNSTNEQNESDNRVHHHEHDSEDHRCGNPTNSTGNFTGEDGCKEINWSNNGHHLGQIMNQFGINNTSWSDGMITSDKNKHALSDIMTGVEHGWHSNHAKAGHGFHHHDD